MGLEDKFGRDVFIGKMLAGGMVLLSGGLVVREGSMVVNSLSIRDFKYTRSDGIADFTASLKRYLSLGHSEKLWEIVGDASNFNNNRFLSVKVGEVQGSLPLALLKEAPRSSYKQYDFKFSFSGDPEVPEPDITFSQVRLGWRLREETMEVPYNFLGDVRVKSDLKMDDPAPDDPLGLRALDNLLNSPPRESDWILTHIPERLMNVQNVSFAEAYMELGGRKMDYAIKANQVLEIASFFN